MSVAVHGAKEQPRIVSSEPARRWQDGLIGGNGATGIMVLGDPADETIIVNHEKCWVQMAAETRQVANLRKTMKQARRLAAEHKFGEAETLIDTTFREWNQARYPNHPLERGKRISSDRPHPAFHLRWETAVSGQLWDYTREMVLETGEIHVRWMDDRGGWTRRIFVSRPDDVIAWQMRPPQGADLTGTLCVTEAPGKGDGDVGKVTIDHRGNELYFYSAYGRDGGRSEPEGYHALGRIVCRGGSARAEDGRVRVELAEEVLVLVRVLYLDRASAAHRDALRDAVSKLPSDYDGLLARHADVHGTMFGRVRLDLGGGRARGRTTEEILVEAAENGVTPALLELLHDVGRYALISSSGDLPPALMGIWGNTWQPPWNGRYTFDSNLNLAVSAGNTGNMPEAMDSFYRFIESLYRDWEISATRLHGCRGYMSEIAQGWRHGKNMHGWVGLTGCAGWLSTYFYEHYLCTGDRAFLRNRVVPLLKNIALFYTDFLEGMEDENGRYLFYPSVSPENKPSKMPGGSCTSISPNATSEIAICKSVLRNLIDACQELGIESESIPTWEGMLKKMPDYRINDDGALAEWSYPGIEDNYNHRHGSHFFDVYPGLAIDPYTTPRLYKAAQRALELKVKAGMGNKAAHGLVHNAFFAARFKDPEMLWFLLDFLARNRYLNTSLISSHNPNLRIYNLDATLSLPAILMEMLAYSKPGVLELLPALPARQLARGSIEGMLARGGITIEKLTWNMPAGEIKLQVRSKDDQTIALGAPRPIAKSTLLQGQARVDPSKRGPAWRDVALRGGESTTLSLELGK
jgi:hypothetical protein